MVNIVTIIYNYSSGDTIILEEKIKLSVRHQREDERQKTIVLGQIRRSVKIY